jgi:hypothetical protein
MNLRTAKRPLAFLLKWSFDKKVFDCVQASKESISSYESNAGEPSDGASVSGEIQFGMAFNDLESVLEISVKQCRQLAVADTKKNTSSPSV